MNLFKACLPHYVDSAQIHQLCSQWWKTDRVSILHYIDRTVSCCDSVGFADWEGWGGNFEVTGITLIQALNMETTCPMAPKWSRLQLLNVWLICLMNVLSVHSNYAIRVIKPSD